MFDLLGQILPAAGAAAGGMVEGQKLYDDRARLMQVMALAKAQEERQATLFPHQLEGQMNQNKLFPAQLEAGQLANQQSRFVQNNLDPETQSLYEQVINTLPGSASRGNVDLTGVPRQDVDEVFKALNALGIQTAMTNRKTAPTGDKVIELERHYTKLWSDLNKLQTPKDIIDYALANDAELGAAVRNAPSTASAQQLKNMIKARLKQIVPSGPWDQLDAPTGGMSMQEAMAREFLKDD